MLTFKPFSKIDWMSYSGAESFADGAEPLISVGDVLIDDQPAEVVVDAVGVQVMWTVDDDTYSVRAEAAGGARLLAMLRARMTYTDLITPVTGGCIERC